MLMSILAGSRNFYTPGKHPLLNQICISRTYCNRISRSSRDNSSSSKRSRRKSTNAPCSKAQTRSVKCELCSSIPLPSRFQQQHNSSALSRDSYTKTISLMRSTPVLDAAATMIVTESIALVVVVVIFRSDFGSS